MIKILITGVSGKMGLEVVKALTYEPELKLVSGIDINHINKDCGKLAGIESNNIFINNNLIEGIHKTKPDVMVDFTVAKAAYENIKIALKEKVRIVVGTTGLTNEQIEEIDFICKQNKIGGIIAPNFAIGAVLMMKCAALASKYFKHAEIIELHHDKKKDSPSGTAIKTSEMMLKERQNFNSGLPSETVERIKGCRGGKSGNINIHSIRLPGMVAHQEVIFGGLGETLTIRHDSISRESFMPGVILAIKKVMELYELIYGLENII